ncbi:peptidoglycan-binding protein [Cellulomonas algicola]|uniref:peptidoglycan-binding domain-containing protein n=1 Tax=Cellulomonas algicola TaxID=2071633 RepID=UPI001C3F85C5|nr:peptidoglycan-binding domain-containing protein [Cellulomonas algicola]
MRRTTVVAVGWCLTIAVTAAVAWWASRATFTPPQPQASAVATQTFTVAEGTIGKTADLTVVATWTARPVGSAAFDGVVTTLATQPGQVVDSGDTLVTVNLQPVVVAKGAVPAFRDLTVGISGEDVRQLQQMLSAKGHLRPVAVNGKFDERTASAVRAWQKSLGVEQSGTVARGTVLFLPDLPVRVALDETITVGATVGIGDPLVSAVDSSPTFTVSGNLEQRSDVPEVGTAVTVDVDGTALEGVVSSVEPTEDGGIVRLVLTAVGGGPLCGTQCDTVPFSLKEQRFAGTAQIAPEVTGPMVPISTMGTGSDGSTFVIRDGERVRVRVLASDGARAVVDGVDVGDVVELFGKRTSDDQRGGQAASEPADRRSSP